MHALYSRRCIPFLRAMADNRDLKIQKLFLQDELRVASLGEGDLTMIGAGLRSFQNINTPEDLARLEAEITDRS